MPARTGVFCGDGTTNGGEVCDDGNTTTESACPYGTASCTACTANCGAQFSLTGPRCGDTVTNGANGEVCDDGNVITETSCAYGSPTCTVCAGDCLSTPAETGEYCGDNITNGPEVCDDGNTTTEASCPYGTATCNICNGACTAQLPRTGATCGDGITNGTGADLEICDDGNTTTETSCPYGQASCLLCDATCDAELPLTGVFCGDGIVNGPEVCDDGNSQVCGTCNATCTASQPAVEASGSIRTVTEGEFNDGQTVTLNDGVNPVSVFIIKKSSGFDAGTALDGGPRYPVDLTVCSNCNTGETAAAFVSAINSVDAGSLLITATINANHPKVRLRHDLIGSIGNQPITDDVADSDFTTTGMIGGGGADCAIGVGCVTNDDCFTGVCGLPDAGLPDGGMGDAGTTMYCQ